MRLVAVLLVVLAATTTADAGRGTAVLKYLPDDTTMIVVADVAHMRGAALLPEVITVGKRAAPRWSAADVGTLVDTYVAAATGPVNASSRASYTIIDGKVDALLAKLDQQGKRSEGGVTIYKLADAEAAIVDAHLIVAPAGEMGHVLERVHGKRASAATSDIAAPFRASLSSATGTDIWGGIALDDATRTGVRPYLGDILWCGFAMAIASGATLEVRLGMSDEAGAKATASTIASKLEDPDIHSSIAKVAGEGFVGAMTIDQDHAVVRVAGAMSGDELKLFATTMKAWF